MSRSNHREQLAVGQKREHLRAESCAIVERQPSRANQQLGDTSTARWEPLSFAQSSGDPKPCLLASGARILRIDLEGASAPAARPNRKKARKGKLPPAIPLTDCVTLPCYCIVRRFEPHVNHPVRGVFP